MDLFYHLTLQRQTVCRKTFLQRETAGQKFMASHLNFASGAALNSKILIASYYFQRRSSVEQ